jgi:NADPH-dependent curcumin reductase CurA
MSESNRRFLLRERPAGRIDASTFELSEAPVPEIGDGEALVRVTHISLDPTNRMWINDVPTYLPPVGIGEVMRGVGVGRVVASRHPGYEEGSHVTGLTGWQDYVVAGDHLPLTPIPADLPAPPEATLGILGVTGITAYYGLTEVAEVREGETVVVSAAAGAVGSAAGQIAKILGARAVGIAGGPEKCRFLLDDLGYDAAVDYKAPDFREQLAAATPDGVDVDFENVGGEVMDAVFARLNLRARVALCGLISGYNEADPPPGPRNMGVLLVNRVTLRGFIILDWWERFPEAMAQLGAWLAEGRLTNRETVVEGFERLPSAINMLFDGANTGKLIVRL